MRVVVQDTLKNKRWVAYEGDAGFVIGRDESCTVSLSTSKFVSRRHVQVEKSADGWTATVAPGATPVVIDGEKVEAGSSGVWQANTILRVAEFAITLEEKADTGVAKRAAEEDVNALQREVHAAVLRRLDLRRSGSTTLDATADGLEQIDAIIDDVMHGEFRGRLIDNRDTRRRLIVMGLEQRLMFEMGGGAQASSADSPADEHRVEVPGFNPVLHDEATRYVRRIAKRLELEMIPEAGDRDFDRIEAGFIEKASEVADETPDNVQFYVISQMLKKTLTDMIFGLGPLQDLLDTPNITEIMIVSPSLVFVERSGKVVKDNRTFLGDEQLLSVIERIVAPLGRRIDRSTPLVDARLKDGSRVNAVIPPLALKGPCLTIRRFPMKRLEIEDLVKWRSITHAGAALLEACVRGYKNVVVAGGTGSGKTTLLNVLSSFIPEGDRTITIEDAAELQLHQEHVVSLETRPPNVEGKGAYTIRDLVKNSLRMRPDRIIVGECRGHEAFDMLQAMNTGHSGSMTTVHSNSAQDALARFETMYLMAVEVPLSAVRRQMSQALDMIVYQKRLKNGRRIVAQITEIGDINPLTGEIETRDIMKMIGDGDDARLIATGYMPQFLDELVERKLIDLDRWFSEVA
ncbi:MAG: ATPase, T2SS/T4P/T4SS family [Planctomycetota bacterium]